MASPRHWDARLHAYVGGLPTSPADAWLRRLSTFANSGKLWLVVAGLLGARKGQQRRAALRGVFSMTAASLVANAVLKPIFGRVRPDFSDHPTLRQLRRPPASRSFPSGHSATAAGFVTGVAMESPLAGAALAPLAIGVGYSRVHVGVHYPGDVIAGMAVGSAGTSNAGRTRAGACGRTAHQRRPSAATAPPTAMPATTSPG